MRGRIALPETVAANQQFPREAQTAVGKTAAGNWGNGIVARGEPPGAKWPGDIRSVRNV